MRRELFLTGPNTERNLDFLEESPRASYFDGKFYQPAGETSVEERRAAVLPYINGEIHPSLMPLEVYQNWAELDWKVPHGTPAAQSRTYDKSREEGNELVAELQKIVVDFPYEQPGVMNKAECTDELGDALWVISQIASNCSVSLDEAVRAYLHYMDLGRKTGPSLTFVDVDYLIAIGHNPTLGPLDTPDNFEIYDPMIELASRISSLNVHSLQAYGDRDLFFSGVFRKYAEMMKPQIGDTIALIGYYAQQWVGVTLGEVAAHNITKVTNRVATDLVDKTDGVR
jgi:hypothetical protein